MEPVIQHKEILLSCLRLMREKLKRNICNLDDYAVLSEVKDLSTCKKEHIGEALAYACQFWTKHLLGTPDNSPCVQEVQKAIEQSSTVHLLHWVEVLVIMGNLSVGIHAVNDVEQWCTRVSGI